MAVEPRQGSPASKGLLRELAFVFLRLGTTAFGGPAAHIAMMRSEFVERRQWVSEEDFLDLIGTSNLLPGPSSTEVALFIGLRLAGPTGLMLAGICFILPAMVIVSILAWAYLRFGHLPQTADLLYGIKPVVIAIIAQAIWNLGRTAIKSAVTAAVAVAGVVASLLGVLPFLLLFASGTAVSVLYWANNRRREKLQLDKRVAWSIAAIFALPLLLTILGQLEPHELRLGTLFLVFVKIGSMVFGSGYVLLAFLRTELVAHLHWLTNTQLLDAVAVGQFTPGPVFTTATFIGFLLKGPVGAVVATAGIFLPAFVYVAAAGKIVANARSSAITGAFLDGVNAAAIALMTVAGCLLAVSALVDSFTFVLAALCAAVLLRFKINSAWLVLAGGAFGLVARQFFPMH